MERRAHLLVALIAEGLTSMADAYRDISELLPATLSFDRFRAPKYAGAYGDWFELSGRDHWALTQAGTEAAVERGADQEINALVELAKEAEQRRKAGSKEHHAM